MDTLRQFLDAKAKIRFVTAEVTMAAKALAARHLNGPTAALALAEGLVGAALLSPDAATPDEAVLLRLTVSGPIGGLTVEATGAGALRGFTNTKILNELDARPVITTDEAWGESGLLQVLTSRPGQVLNQASVNISPPRMRQAVARYFSQSLQIPTACEIMVRGDGGGIIKAAGILAQRMVDTDSAAFVKVLERFEDHTVRQWLQDGGDRATEELRRILALPDIEERRRVPLRFECRCSQEKILGVLKTLGADELRKMADSGQGQTITCHMCGKGYEAAPGDIRKVLEGLAQEDQQSGSETGRK